MAKYTRVVIRSDAFLKRIFFPSFFPLTVHLSSLDLFCTPSPSVAHNYSTRGRLHLSLSLSLPPTNILLFHLYLIVITAIVRLSRSLSIILLLYTYINVLYNTSALLLLLYYYYFCAIPVFIVCRHRTALVVVRDDGRMDGLRRNVRENRLGGRFPLFSARSSLGSSAQKRNYENGNTHHNLTPHSQQQQQQQWSPNQPVKTVRDVDDDHGEDSTQHNMKIAKTVNNNNDNKRKHNARWTRNSPPLHPSAFSKRIISKKTISFFVGFIIIILHSFSRYSPLWRSFTNHGVSARSTRCIVKYYRIVFFSSKRFFFH